MLRNGKPAPLDLSPPPKARLDARRGSRNDLPPPGASYVPPSSAFDWDDDGKLNRLERRVRRAKRGLGVQTRMLRLAFDCLHILACMVPVLMVAMYLGQVEGAVASATGPATVVLIAILGVDVALDIQSIGLFDRPWAGWCLLLRATCVIVYVALFIRYVVAGGIFTRDYSYFELPPAATAAIVYVSLWALATWNVAHGIVNRERIVSETRRYYNRVFYSASTSSRATERGRTMQRGRSRDIESWGGWRSDSEPRSVTEIIYTPTVAEWDHTTTATATTTTAATEDLLKGRNKSGSVSSNGSTETSSSGWSGHTYTSLETDYSTALRVPPAIKAKTGVSTPAARSLMPSPTPSHAPIFTTPQKLTVVPLITIEYPPETGLPRAGAMKNMNTMNTMNTMTTIMSPTTEEKIMMRGHIYDRWNSLGQTQTTTSRALMNDNSSSSSAGGALGSGSESRSNNHDDDDNENKMAGRDGSNRKRTSRVVSSVYSLASRASRASRMIISRASGTRPPWDGNSNDYRHNHHKEDIIIHDDYDNDHDVYNEIALKSGKQVVGMAF